MLRILRAESYSGCAEASKIYSKQLAHIVELIQKKMVRPPPLTAMGSLSIDTVQKAHQLLEEGKVKGKLVMDIF